MEKIPDYGTRTPSLLDLAYCVYSTYSISYTEDGSRAFPSLHSSASSVMPQTRFTILKARVMLKD